MLQSLAEILPKASQEFGEKLALVIDSQEFTYSQLDKLSNQLASGLRDLGVREGDRVTLYSPNSWQWLVSYYGILKIGAVVNPVNVMLTPDEIRFIVRDAGVRMVIASKEKGMTLFSQGITEELDHLVMFGEDLPEGVTNFDSLIDQSSGNFTPPNISTDSLSTICYTSGTTGTPKGAMLSHKAVLMNTEMTALMHGTTSTDTVVSALPCPHVYGNVVMNSCLLFGGTLVLLPAFKEETILDLIQRYRATKFEGVPTMYMYLLNHPDTKTADFSSLRICTVGGQAMPQAKMEAVEQVFGCPLIELWGMTEIGGLGTTFAWSGPHKLGSIGTVLPYLRVKIADAQDSNLEMPEGEVGELLVKGPMVMMGYFGNENATGETIDVHGWLRTGDLARIDSDGCVYVVDRKKDMIITAGFNVYPAELERVIAAHPDVALVAVGAIYDEDKGQLPKAYIVPRAGATCSKEDIITHCRTHLAAYKVPRSVQFVGDLPRTSTGKIMRRRLQQLDD